MAEVVSKVPTPCLERSHQYQEGNRGFNLTCEEDEGISGAWGAIMCLTKQQSCLCLVHALDSVLRESESATGERQRV
eukprot:5104028-Pleurochrysis_carterae.AAC.2